MKEIIFHIYLSLIHISEPTSRTPISYAVFCLKKGGVGVRGGETGSGDGFFQAEDGIRDRSPSRGLGDVYKRQLHDGAQILISS